MNRVIWDGRTASIRVRVVAACDTLHSGVAPTEPTEFPARRRRSHVLNKSATANESFTAPRYWLTWLGLALWRAASVLPLPILYLIGLAIGELIYLLIPKRRRVTATNIDLCFPELDPKARRRMTRSCFHRVGQSIFDIGVAAWSTSARLNRLVEVEDGDRLRRTVDAAVVAKQNVILLAPHFVCVGAGALYLARKYPVFAIYKSPTNPVFAAAYRRATSGEPTGNAVLDRLVAPIHKESRLGLIGHRDSMKPMIRKLRAGEMLYYPSDQALGKRQSVVAPFFGIETTSLAAASRLTRLANAVLLPCALIQRPFGGGYRLLIADPITFDGDVDKISETTLQNQAIEDLIRRAPEQYFWLHQRFKPVGETETSVYS